VVGGEQTAAPRDLSELIGVAELDRLLAQARIRRLAQQPAPAVIGVAGGLVVEVGFGLEPAQIVIGHPLDLAAGQLAAAEATALVIGEVGEAALGVLLPRLAAQFVVAVAGDEVMARITIDRL